MFTVALEFSKRARMSSSGLVMSPPVSVILALSMTKRLPNALNDPCGTVMVPSAVGAPGFCASDSIVR